MKFGWIGAGNMARAMMKGVIQGGVVPAADVAASDLSDTALEAASALGVQTMKDNRALAEQCGVVVLAVKPQFYACVIDEIAPVLPDKALIVTIAPGWTLERLQTQFGGERKIVRCMPNTPAMVGEGMTAVCPNGRVSETELHLVTTLLESFGKCAVVPERLMDAVVAVSGSSPAYVYMFIEALADAGVYEGMPRDLSYQFAAQAVLGSAKMVLETGLHPGALKDMVCSPAGTTIESVRVLEERGMRSAVFEAALAASRRCKQ